ncbi:hypothetical protein Gotri_007886 [Gossypium trilobum]|uniref:Uncharacterized protein n=1 Tax=Gossypium trilobum TaxID=34281 RepID=A0A7J9EHM7_9ROSI|nr:hypothetical protein [Gossypium trilobum]
MLVLRYPRIGYLNTVDKLDLGCSFGSITGKPDLPYQTNHWRSFREYSVRSGYKLLLQGIHTPMPNYNKNTYTHFYKKLWLLNLPLFELEYKKWLAYIFLNNSIYQCRIVDCAIWAIWTAMNKAVYERDRQIQT